MTDNLSLTDIEWLREKATDGPWSIGAPQDKIIAVDDSGSVRTTSNGWGKVIARTGARSWHGPNEDMSNAALIAAAPILARQLAATLRELEAVKAGLDDDIGGKCESGCQVFHGGELKHDINCVFYPESLTELMDKRNARIAAQDKRIEELERHLADMITSQHRSLDILDDMASDAKNRREIAEEKLRQAEIGTLSPDLQILEIATNDSALSTRDDG